jgi:hypothetical protein
VAPPDSLLQTAEVLGPAPAGPLDHVTRLSTQPYPDLAQTLCPYVSPNQNDHYQFSLAAGLPMQIMPEAGRRLAHPPAYFHCAV